MAGARGLTARWVCTVELMQKPRRGTLPQRWERLCTLGRLRLVNRAALGLFCSARCPGNVILAVYDLARALREAGVAVISGFHTPMERECLELLLRGGQPVIVCPARGIGRMRLSAAIRAGIDAERVLLLSPFEVSQRRVTAELAEERNRLVAALASEVFVAYAEPGGKTERLCRDVIASGKPVLTLGYPENGNLIALGAQPTCVEQLVRRWSRPAAEGEDL